MPSTPLEVLWPQIQGTQFARFSDRKRANSSNNCARDLFESLGRVPNDQRAQKLWSRQIAAPSSPAASNPCVRVNQMADDIERAPSVFTFISERPRFR